MIEVNPYLFFRGNASEAIEFYKNIFGGELAPMSYADAHTPAPAGLTDASLMHVELKGGDIHLMASDTAEASEIAKKISISISGDDEEKLTKIFTALSEGVDVKYPLKKESWGDVFGSVTDKYGIEWMVNISQTQQ